MRFRDRNFSGRLVRALFLFLITIVANPFCAFAQKDSVPAEPKLVIDGDTHDFGTVGQGTLVKHDFIIKNGGDAPLVLQRIVPACGCTAVSSAKGVIKPGEQTELVTEFDTTGFSGEKVKIVRIYTNDPDKLSSVLTLKGRVEPDVIVEPTRVNFGNVYPKGDAETLSKEITVSVREGSDVKLGDVAIRSKYITLDLKSSTSKKKVFVLKLLPKATLGELRDRIVIKVTGSRQKSVHVPIFANIKGPLQLTPASVSFGVLEGAETITRSVRLENKSATPMTIMGLKSKHSAITVTKAEITPGKIYVLKITVDPSKVSVDLRSSIEVKTNIGEQDILRVSVYGIMPPEL